MAKRHYITNTVTGEKTPIRDPNLIRRLNGQLISQVEIRCGMEYVYKDSRGYFLVIDGHMDWTLLPLAEDSQRVISTKQMEKLIEKLRRKLEDPVLTEGQYKAIEGILERKIKSLEEGKIY